MARSSIHINDDVKAKLKEKHVNISGMANELFKIFIKNKFSTDFGSKSTNNTELKRKLAFLKREAKRIDALMIELKVTHYDPKPEGIKIWLEKMKRNGITQDNYIKYIEMINQ